MSSMNTHQSFLKIVSAIDCYDQGYISITEWGYFQMTSKTTLLTMRENQQQAAYWTFGVTWSVWWNELEISSQTFVIERVVITHHAVRGVPSAVSQVFLLFFKKSVPEEQNCLSPDLVGASPEGDHSICAIWDDALGQCTQISATCRPHHGTC